MDWLTDQKVITESSRLRATESSSTWDEELDVAPTAKLSRQGNFINFSSWEIRHPLTFKPSYGEHWFWHKGRFFQLDHEERQMMTTNGWASIMRDTRLIRLSCVGRSSQPIKDLIEECQDHYFNMRSFRTTIRRPAIKEMRQRGRQPWVKVAKRPSRPIDTVILDTDQKELILVDINEYLHPTTPRWYAIRGIPYRRGYLSTGHREPERPP
jgi:mitochondrial chaperone BCS1